jgi:HEAT repeat protein
MDEAALPELIGALNDADARVRAAALHALACERCKEGECRPAEDEVLPIVFRMLEEDSSREVRSGAVNLLFQIVHRRQDALEALERARDSDPEPIVREEARLRTPGGVMWMRTSPDARDRRGLRTSNSRRRLTVK